MIRRVGSVAQGLPGRQRQHPVLAIERLARSLLVHTEKFCVRRLVQVQPYHIGPLDSKFGPLEAYVGVQPVRAHAVLAPDALHGGERHVAEFARQVAAASGGGHVGQWCL